MIQGTGGLEVVGGTQTLSGVNTYTNATQIDAGATLALKGSGSIASSAIVDVLRAQARTFDISQTTSGTSVTRPVLVRRLRRRRARIEDADDHAVAASSAA